MGSLEAAQLKKRETGIDRPLLRWPPAAVAILECRVHAIKWAIITKFR
jgi:hypothetical protein